MIRFLLLFLLGCTAEKDIFANKRTSRIYELTVNSGYLVGTCFQTAKDDERVFLNLYVLSKNQAELFYSQIKLHPKNCQERLSMINKIYQKGEPFVISGSDPSYRSYVEKEEKISENGLPIKVKTLSSFIRILTSKGCFGHFGEYCDEGFDEDQIFIND